MTAQISDVVDYRRKTHSIAGVSGSGLFDPADQGIRTVMISTACWRGFHCSSESADGTLLLTTVNVGLADKDRARAERGEGPELFGHVPRRYTIHGHSHDLRTGAVKTEWESSDFRYDGLREPVAFSGGLLLGDGFIQELYVHMGFHPAWKFRTVHEVLFEGGRVVEEADRSAEMAAVRKKMSGRPPGPADPDDVAEIGRWVEQCFSLRYK